MAREFKRWKDESRRDWGAYYNDGEKPSNENIQIGAILRIADATEAMAKNYTDLQAKAERYERLYYSATDRAMRLERRISSLKGVITKLKKKNK